MEEVDYQKMGLDLLKIPDLVSEQEKLIKALKRGIDGIQKRKDELEHWMLAQVNEEKDKYTNQQLREGETKKRLRNLPEWNELQEEESGKILKADEASAELGRLLNQMRSVEIFVSLMRLKYRS